MYCKRRENRMGGSNHTIPPSRAYRHIPTPTHTHTHTLVPPTRKLQRTLLYHTQVVSPAVLEHVWATQVTGRYENESTHARTHTRIKW